MERNTVHNHRGDFVGATETVCPSRRPRCRRSVVPESKWSCFLEQEKHQDTRHFPKKRRKRALSIIFFFASEPRGYGDRSRWEIHRCCFRGPSTRLLTNAVCRNIAKKGWNSFLQIKFRVRRSTKKGVVEIVVDSSVVFLHLQRRRKHFVKLLWSLLTEKLQTSFLYNSCSTVLT